MPVSRRAVLLQGGVIGAGFIAADLSGVRALAQAPPLPERRSLRGLAWNDPIVETYRDAVGQLKNRPDGDLFNWVNLAKIHGTDVETYHLCPHGNWYFLPWHRAYLLMYERLIRDVTGNPSFALPFWDWTEDPRLPEIFVEPRTPDGKPNWLYVADPGYERTWPSAEPLPSENVGPAVLRRILTTGIYEQFATSRPSGQNSLDPSWVVDRDAGVQGELEGNLHNMVHNHVGGWMPTSMSPRDPLFLAHHSNIDRIWAVWNALGNPNCPDPLWRDMRFERHFYNVDGTFASPTVSELLLPEPLGYTYGLAPPAAAASPHVMALRDNLTTLYAGARPAGSIVAYTVANAQGAASAGDQPLELVVDVDSGLVAAVARRPPPGAGAELVDAAAARERLAAGTRALAFIREVAVTQPRTMIRLFLDGVGLSPATPVTDPHYVGSFAVFGHAAHAGGHAKPSFVVDLTDPIGRVYGGRANPPGRLTLQVLAVPSRSAHGTVGSVTLGRIEVAFVTS